MYAAEFLRSDKRVSPTSITFPFLSLRRLGRACSCAAYTSVAHSLVRLSRTDTSVLTSAAIRSLAVSGLCPMLIQGTANNDSRSDPEGGTFMSLTPPSPPTATGARLDMADTPPDAYLLVYHDDFRVCSFPMEEV